MWKHIFYLYENHAGAVIEVKDSMSNWSSHGVMVWQHQWNIVCNTQQRKYQ